MVSVGGGSSSESSRPQRVNVWNKQQKQIGKVLGPIIESGLGQPVPRYPGQLYVPTTEAESRYLQSVGQGASGDYASASEAVRRALSGKVPYELGPQWAEKYFEEAIRPVAMREFRETFLPQIRESFAGPGYYGSARGLVETKGAEDLATQLAAQRASLMYGEELARRQAEESAANRAAQMASVAYPQTVEAARGAGEYERGIEQEKVAADFQRWLMGEEVEGTSPMMYNPFIQIALDFLGLRPIGIGQVTSGSSSSFSFGIR